MKLTIVILFNLIFISLVSAQHQEEFNISLSQDKMILKGNEQKEILVTLHCSRSYAKLKSSLTVSSALPEGVEINFEPASGIISESIAHIRANETAKPGTYFIVINCTKNHKNKGSMLKLTIDSASSDRAKL